MQERNNRVLRSPARKAVKSTNSKEPMRRKDMPLRTPKKSPARVSSR
jgi:hypothetical protein